MIPRRRFLLTLSGLFGASVTPGILRAAPKKKAPAATVAAAEPAAAASKETSNLRLWKTADSSAASISVRLLPLGKTGAALSPLRIDEQEYQFTNYVDVPVGPATVEISVPGQPPIQMPRYFAADGKLTLLVRFQNAKLSAEWIDDTAAPDGGGCVFRVYNLLPYSGEVEVTLGTLLTVHLPTIRSSVRLNDIKPAVYPITVKGTGDGGKEFSANLDLDFGQCRRATLLICPDAYGRVRPRINAV